MLTLRFLVAFLTSLLILYGTDEASGETFAYTPRSDGKITTYRVTASGAFEPVRADPIPPGNRPLALVLSADKRFLYAYPEFDRGKDGHNTEEIGDEKRIKVVASKPTPITVFSIGEGGVLRRLSILAVPAPLGQLVPHPGGRFVYGLTATRGAFILRVARNGTLTLAGGTPVESGMGLGDIPGERDAWGLTFSPNGDYLYAFRGDGFVDHAENYLRRYKVNRASGRLMPDGKPWDSRSEKTVSVALDPGMVRFFVSNTAFVKGFAGGIWVCRGDGTGRILSQGSRLTLVPKGQAAYGNDQLLMRHPKLPFVVYRGSETDPYSLWRVTAPGKVSKIAAFASAFPERSPVAIYTDPSGRFLYEIQVLYPARQARVAVFAWDKTGTRIALAMPPQTIPNADSTDFVFVAPPVK
ncbi:MAG: hypothetical protein H8F28_19555 [Fibrella sp.]|nr:hypothetical protein [Armatimonadota bacterium]